MKTTTKQVKREEIKAGTRYLAGKLGEVMALQDGRQKLFVRVLATGETAYIGYRQLRQVPAPVVVVAPVQVAVVAPARPRVTIAQVMHSIELAEVRSIRPARTWSIPAWAKVAAGIAGFAAGLAAGMGPVAALVGG